MNKKNWQVSKSPMSKCLTPIINLKETFWMKGFVCHSNTLDYTIPCNVQLYMCSYTFLNAHYISCSFKHISKYTKRNLIAFLNHMKFTNNYVVSYIVIFFSNSKELVFFKVTSSQKCDMTCSKHEFETEVYKVWLHIFYVQPFFCRNM